MISLLDVNVLLALAWPDHLHHRAAHAWFQEHQPLGWATCPLTQSGFVRISSNAKVFRYARAPGAAVELLRKIVAVPSHQFWVDDLQITSAPEFSALALVGHRQVTDAHLLSLARRRGGRLATFDRGVARLLPAGISAEAAIALVPAGSP